MSEWVCSICGSARIDPATIQPSLGDPRHPLGLCWDCRGSQPLPPSPGDKSPKPVSVKPVRHPLSPLCHPDEYTGKHRRPKPAEPLDVFGALPEAERKALERPVR
jgi:hypothetical protein